MGLSEARRCDIWYNAHTKSKGEFAVKEALREVVSQFCYLVCSLCRTFGAIGNI